LQPKCRTFPGLLKANPLKFNDKAVKSVSSRVTNISEHLSRSMDIEDFIKKIRDHVHSLYPDAQDYEFTPEEIDIINEMVKAKYSTWDWNYGKSPKYNYFKAIRTAGGTFEFYLQVSRGFIVSLKIFGDFFPVGDPAELEQMLIGVPHNEEILRNKLAWLDLSLWFNNITADDILSGLF